MLNAIVVGAAGKMGKLIIKNILATKDIKLVGAIEAPKCKFLNKDAGIAAGTKQCNILISDKLKPFLSIADIIIDFSTGPLIDTAKIAVKNNVAIVIGTTGLKTKDKQILLKLSKNGGKIVLSSNMSIGANILFSITKFIAETLKNNYDAEIIELHHNEKKDAPSGTAKRLAEIISAVKKTSKIETHSLRIGDVVGEHTVIFATNGERIELTHKVSSRETFAIGAIQAARFLQHAKPGLYDMQDILGIKL